MEMHIAQGTTSIVLRTDYPTLGAMVMALQKLKALIAAKTQKAA